MNKSTGQIILVTILGLLLAVLIGVLIFLTLPSNSSTNVEMNISEPIKKQNHSTNMSYNINDSLQLSDVGALYELDTFIVNTHSQSGRRYLKTTISLEVGDEDHFQELSDNTPIIRDRIIRILSSKSIEDVVSRKGKEKLSKEIVENLNHITSGEIRNMFFTEFVIQ